MAASPAIIRQITANPCTDTACANAQDDCYAGQWTVHPAHHYEVRLMAWQGGGVEQRHCPGRTKATKL